MKYTFLAITLLLIAGCGQKEKCRFSTVEDLDNLDLKECPPGDFYHHDTIYYNYVRKFSSGFENTRKEKGIPKLPKDFQVITWSVDYQVRWRNAEIIKKIYADSNYRQPYMERKDIEWNKNTLKYDRTNFSSMDSLESYLNVEYFLDTVVTPNVYRFNYWYSNINMQPGKASSVTKQQADSILKAWKIDY